MDDVRAARALGWFSIGLGLAEVTAARRLGRSLGIEGSAPLLRAFGAREIANGIGILSSPDTAAWMWGRVGGDVLDLAALGAGMRPSNRRRGRLGVAIGAVAAVTALDILCARSLGRRGARQRRQARRRAELQASGGPAG